MGIQINGDRLQDKEGRDLIFRGVNLPGKTPMQTEPVISFVGRPFPLVEADEHFSRLKYWGFNLFRLCVAWEGVEHTGLGLYDEGYLDYLEKLTGKAAQYGFKIFIDFHQDVWSRFTGGDGAPEWTLALAGFQVDNLESVGATVLYNGDNHRPHILWATNAYKLAAATMFTLFFGASRLAPKRNIEGLLQEAYIRMMQKVAERMRGNPAILGYDVMNEPFPGYIGCKNLDKAFGILQLGDTPTPFEGMVLGDGGSLPVDVWEQKFFAIRNTGKQQLNLGRGRAWQEGTPCVWREAGLWDYDDQGKPLLLRPDYFAAHSFEEEFYKPFINKAGRAIHEVEAKAMILIEHIAGSTPPMWGESDVQNVVFTGHWYDAFVLVTKQFFTFLGFDMVRMKPLVQFPQWMRKTFARQIRHFKTLAQERCRDSPLIITEFGIPFDLEGDHAMHNKALHRSFLALEDNLTSAIIWNYTAHNSDELGDHWNEENLSIFRKDPQDPTRYSGARAKEALVRPYPQKTAGKPLHMHFHLAKKTFEYQFEHNPHLIDHPTEIFIPDLHFGKGVTVHLSDGRYEIEGQTLKYYPSDTQLRHTIKIHSQ